MIVCSANFNDFLVLLRRPWKSQEKTGIVRSSQKQVKEQEKRENVQEYKVKLKQMPKLVLGDISLRSTSL